MLAPVKVALLVVAVTYVNAAKLPSYITPCSRNPATLRDCATKEARNALPTLLNGDRHFKIPNLKPLKLPEVKIDAGENLKIKLTDVVIDGFEDFNVEYVDINLEKQHIGLKLQFPRLVLLSQYDINGRILVLPIQGKGPANITFVGGDYKYTCDFELVKRGNEEYMNLIKPALTYTTKRSYFQLDNLFNGDKVLGDQMNKFLDENWQDVSEDLGPALANVISTIATAIINGFIKKIPMDELFAP